MDYVPYKEFLKKVFPKYKRVRKLPLHGGMSCPNLDGTKGYSGCTYCNNQSFSPVFDQAKVSVATQLAERIPVLRKKYPDAGILAYFQPYTNTYAPAAELKEIYLPALRNPEIAGIAIGTRPDCLPFDVVELLAEMNAVKPIIVEVGLQTSNDQTLNAINRRHTFAEFENAVQRLHQAGLTVTTHLIIGLPGETMKDFVRTAHEVKRLKISAAKLHPLHIVCGTQMAQDYANGEFELLSFEDYCKAVAAMITEFNGKVAVERFSGESPDELLIAPDWCGEREKIVAEVERILQQQKA